MTYIQVPEHPVLQVRERAVLSGVDGEPKGRVMKTISRFLSVAEGPGYENDINSTSPGFDYAQPPVSDQPPVCDLLPFNL